MILSVGLFFSGCEKDDNGKVPDDLKDSNVGTVKLLETSDMLIDINHPEEFNLDMEVDVLFDQPYNKVELMLVYNLDYTSPYLVETYTSLPGTINMDLQDIVDLVTPLNAIGDVVLGDKFNYYTNIELMDGTLIPGYLSSGVTTTAASVRNFMTILKDASSFIQIPVPCPFVADTFVGTMEVIEQWNDGSGDAYYTVDVSVNTTLTTEEKVVFDIPDIFTNNSLLQLYVDVKSYKLYMYKDPAVAPAEQEIIYHGNLWGYGRLWFEDYTEAELETCKKYMTFTVTPVLNDAGAWWGQDVVTYFIGPYVISGATKKAGKVNEGENLPLMMRPLSPR